MVLKAQQVVIIIIIISFLCVSIKLKDTEVVATFLRHNK